MARRQLQLVLHYLRHLSGPADNGVSTDSHLLERFVAARDETAFALLVQRHGRTVLGVCRRLLHNPDDIDDAFQATFLVLAGKAGSIRRRQSLSSWLYGVAYRVALHARGRLARCRDKEQPLDDYPDERQEDPSDAAGRRELCAVLDEELSRLPDKYRAPLLLCDAEGMSWTMAARELCWAASTLQRRLERGREVLRGRLRSRGVVLPAALLTAVLAEQTALALAPLTAAATSKMALLVAAGGSVTSPAVGALASGVMKTMGLGKLKVAVSCLIVTMVAAGLGLGALVPRMEGQQLGKQAVVAAVDKDSVPAAAKQPAADTEGKMTLTAHILDPSGKPTPNADVAVVSIAYLGADGDRGLRRPEILDQGKADQEGRFRFRLPRDAKARFWVVFLLARSPAHGITRLEVPLDGKQSEVPLRLGADQPLRGRLVDLQGVPANAVRLRVVAFPYRSAGKDFVREFRNPPEALAMWPQPVATDAQGRFALHGVGAVETVRIRIEDERFARQEFDIKAGNRKGQEVTLVDAVPIDIDFGGPNKSRKENAEVTLALEPARILEGQVTYADTGKPAAHARLWAQTKNDGGNPFQGRTYQEFTADQEGRFRFILYPGRFCNVAAFPVAGKPYLPRQKNLTWPTSSPPRKQVNLALVRGVAVAGTIVETPSGKPVAAADVEFTPFLDNNPFYREEFDVGGRFTKCVSGRDGRFQLTIPPGPGHLLIQATTNDYIRSEITTKKLNGQGVSPNRRNYFDGLVPLNLKPGAGRHEVVVKLRRGVSLAGRLVGPDERPVENALMVCRSYIPSPYYNWNPTHTKEIRGGRFELPGCDPEGTSEIFFLDAKNQFGGVAKLSGKQAGKPVTVRLERCGSARARFIDEQGKPLANLRAWPVILITPGVNAYDSLDDPRPTAETAFLASLDRDRYKEPHRTDAQGRIIFPSLFPGATYWLHAQSLGSLRFHRGFRIKPGETLDLGDIRIKTSRSAE